jgi:hypothetical protein
MVQACPSLNTTIHWRCVNTQNENAPGQVVQTGSDCSHRCRSSRGYRLLCISTTSKPTRTETCTLPGDAASHLPRRPPSHPVSRTWSTTQFPLTPS